MTDFDKEYTAFHALQWNPYTFPTDFDPELAALGAYTATQRERSDIELDAWDKAHQKNKSGELQAYYELIRLGVIPETEFFSPTRANPPQKYLDERPDLWVRNYYTGLLKRHQAAISDGTSEAGRSSGATDQGRADEELATTDEGLRSRSQLRRPRSQRRRPAGTFGRSRT